MCAKCLILLAMVASLSCSDQATAPVDIGDVTIETEPLAAEGTTGVVYRFIARTATQPAGLLYEWDFDDGTHMELVDQSFVDYAFSQYGKYTVEVRVVNENGEYQEATFECNIRTNAQPIPHMVEIPTGTFTMGSDVNFQESPRHEVVITRPFAIASTELTQEAFQALMGYNPSWFRGPQLPVEQVSWFQAIEYCNRRSVREGFDPCYTIGNDTIQCDFSANGYRLPTEAEWEYACRAGTTTHFYTGDAVQPLNDCQSDIAELHLSEAGWWCQNADLRTHVGAQKAPNAFGLYDMHGNVSEWVWDWFNATTYTSAIRTNPSGPEFGTERATRGGSWDLGAYNCRAGSRQKPRNPDRKMHSIGFRLAQTLSE